jgi:ribonuclease HI
MDFPSLPHDFKVNVDGSSFGNSSPQGYGNLLVITMGIELQVSLEIIAILLI